MQEQLNEKLSLLLDDQLDGAQALSLLKATRADPALQAKLRRYSLISQALKSEQCAVARADLVGNIHRQLETEPAYFLPRKKAVILSKKPVWLWPHQSFWRWFGCRLPKFSDQRRLMLT